MRRVATIAAATALTAAAIASADAASVSAARAAARPAFRGTATGVSGRWLGLRARVAITFAATYAPVPLGARPLGTFTMTIAPAHDRTRQGGRRLHGRITGSWRTTRLDPEAGSSASLRGAGGVAPLGAVTAAGTGEGTGDVTGLRPVLMLRLVARAGTVRVLAWGPVAPPFTPFP